MTKIRLLMIALVITFTFQSCKKDDNQNIEVAVKIGAQAPNFKIGDIDGTIHELKDYRGQYVVVDFWAAWCGICRNENPKMESLNNSYKDKNVSFIGVCLDANTENWKTAVMEDQLTYIQLIDNEAFDSKVASTYGITSVPFMMVLDSEGVILTITNRVSDIESKLRQVIN